MKTANLKLHKDMQALRKATAAEKKAEATLKTAISSEKTALGRIQAQEKAIIDQFVSPSTALDPATQSKLLGELFTLGESSVTTRATFDAQITKDKAAIAKDKKAMKGDRQQALQDLLPAEYEMSLKDTNRVRKELGLKGVHKPIRPAVRDLHGITPAQRFATQFPDQWSLCGPIAATAAARALGKNVSLAHVRAVAIQGGNYAPFQGMFGADAEVRLLRDLGIRAHLAGGVSPSQIRASLAAGKPVLLSTPNHYFVVEGYDARTGKFQFGESALAMRASNGRTELTLGEVESLGGGAPTPIFLD